MDRSNHYEAAFEAYMQKMRITYMAVDETRRTMRQDVPIKSIDFVVYGEGSRLLVDVKGRRFPTGSKGKERPVWECWSTREDVTGLKRWTELFGAGYEGVLLFTYFLAPHVALPDDTEDLWEFRDRRYLFRAVAVEDYEQKMRIRSPKWDTVTLPRDVFRQVVRPLHHFINGPQPVGDDLPL